MLNSIYTTLLKSYGLQGWWPVTDEGKKQPTYHPKDYSFPRTDLQIFEIMVGAILTQNTTWKNVEKALTTLIHYNLLTQEKIKQTHLKTLAKFIRSSGYHNQKAKKLKHLIAFLEKHPLAELKQLQPSNLRILLLTVNGIGPETADSIVLYAFKKPMFVIDTYTKRIFSRIGICKPDVPYDEIQLQFMQQLPQDTKIYNEYHALIVEHAKRCCMVKPLCKECHIKGNCNYQK